MQGEQLGQCFSNLSVEKDLFWFVSFGLVSNLYWYLSDTE